jgi:hypothetical protein
MLGHEQAQDRLGLGAVHTRDRFGVAADMVEQQSKPTSYPGMA